MHACLTIPYENTCQDKWPDIYALGIAYTVSRHDRHATSLYASMMGI